MECMPPSLLPAKKWFLSTVWAIPMCLLAVRKIEINSMSMLEISHHHLQFSRPARDKELPQSRTGTLKLRPLLQKQSQHLHMRTFNLIKLKWLKITFYNLSDGAQERAGLKSCNYQKVPKGVVGWESFEKWTSCPFSLQTVAYPSSTGWLCKAGPAQRFQPRRKAYFISPSGAFREPLFK